jgi:hypothetical protein
VKILGKIYNPVATVAAFVVGIAVIGLITAVVVANVIDLFDGAKAQESGCNCPFTCETEIHTVDGIDYCDCINCEGFER